MKRGPTKTKTLLVGGPTAGSGRIPRAHREEHEAEIASLQTQINRITNAPAGSTGAGTAKTGGGSAPVVTSIDPPGAALKGDVGIEGRGGVTVSADGNTVVIDAGQLVTLVNTALQAIKDGSQGNNGVLPIGSVILWPTGKPIPAGWAIADGTNGTVDLTGGGKNPYLRFAGTNNLTPDGSLSHSHGIDHDSMTTEPPDGQTCISIQQGSGSTVNAATTTHVHKLPSEKNAATAPSTAADLPLYITVIPIERIA